MHKHFREWRVWKGRGGRCVSVFCLLFDTLRFGSARFGSLNSGHESDMGALGIAIAIFGFQFRGLAIRYRDRDIPLNYLFILFSIAFIGI